MRIVVSSQADDGRVELQYQAPDRAHSNATGDFSTETIYIGNAVYLSDFTRQGFFTVTTVPEGQGPPAESVLFPLRLLDDARIVTERDGIFTVKLDDGTAEAEIVGGYVSRVHLRIGSGETRLDATYQFSDFDEELPPIEAPPADRVVEAQGPHPDCGPHGEPPSGEFICFNPPDSAGPRPIDLPPPTGSTNSTLQFRPVLADRASGCSDDDTNPDSNVVARLSDATGGCYELGPAELEVEEVSEVRATSRPGDGADLHITLSPDDAEHFDRITERHLGERVAIVMFGSVLSAPTVQATGVEGELVISDLEPAVASRISAAL